MNIYIANIPFKAKEDELRELFEDYGQVSSVKIILDKETQRSRGFGFVEMDDDSEARTAIEGVNGKDFLGKVLVVNEARPREPRSDFRPRSNSGGSGYGANRSGGSSRGNEGGGWKRNDRY